MATVNRGKIPVLVGKRLNDAERVTRYMVLGTKLLRVNKKRFYEITGFEMDSIFEKQLQELEHKGLIKNSPNEVSLTTLGKAFSNEVSKAFFTKENAGHMQPLGIDFN